MIETGEGAREEVCLTAAGRTRCYDLTVEPLRGRFGEVRGVTCAAIDISERKRTEQALREADQRKNEFLTMLAHELRNPLAPILSAAEVLNQGSPDPVTSRRHADIIRRHTRHLARLLEDLLEGARATHGKLELRRQVFDARDAVAAAVEAGQPLIASQRHELVISCPDLPVLLCGDPARIQQVVSNLLVNAAKYTEPGGHLELRLRTVEGEAVILVRDSGIGMDGELLPRVLDLFAQGDGSLDRSIGGLGIGLTLVKTLVELHGGSVSAHSEGTGRGSEFTVRLPLASPAEIASDAGCPQIEVRDGALRVLIVDDNRDAAETLQDVLEGWGHTTATAFDGTSALARAAERKPDAVLLDIGLPDLDGYEVAKRLRARFGDTVRIIAVTGYGADADRAAARDAGFDEHLAKPVDPDLLREALASSL